MTTPNEPSGEGDRETVAKMIVHETLMRSRSGDGVMDMVDAAVRILRHNRVQQGQQFWRLATDDPASWPDDSRGVTVLYCDGGQTCEDLAFDFADSLVHDGYRGWYAYARALPPIPKTEGA